MTGLADQLAGALGGIRRQVRIALAGAPFAVFAAHRLEPPHPASLRASCLDALAHQTSSCASILSKRALAGASALSISSRRRR